MLGFRHGVFFTILSANMMYGEAHNHKIYMMIDEHGLQIFEVVIVVLLLLML
jgi:hypothetical protein